MIILTLKERRTIDEAVLNHGTGQASQVWRDWKLAHPDVLTPDNTASDDGTGPMPLRTRNLLIAALTQAETALVKRIASVNDDDAADLSNDAAEIRSIIGVLHMATSPVSNPQPA